MLENCLNDGQVMASQLSAGPQAAWPGSVGHRQGLPGCRSQHPSRKKHRMLVALDVYGQMNTLCKAKALHLWTCSAPWAPCLPCQCPGRARGPGSPSLSKSSNHSGSETDPSHSRTSVSRAWQRDWHSLQLSSALDWVRLLQGVESQAAPRQLAWQHPAMPFTAPFREKISPCSASSRLCSQRFATALGSVTVLQQGYKVGMSKGLLRLPVFSPVLTWRGVCGGGRGQLPRGHGAHGGAVCAGAVQRGGGGRTRGGPGMVPSLCPVSCSVVCTHTRSGRGPQDGGTGGQRVGLGGRRAAALCSVRKL